MSSAYLYLLKERGFLWFFNRSLYSIKLKMLSIIPQTEKLFEKKFSEACRIDLFDVDTDSLKTFLNALPDIEKEKIISDADNACEGRIKGFSSTELDYGMPVNWQLNPITGKSCNVAFKWYKIPDFDTNRGDIKVIWEMSRFSHFFLFARAYLITTDEKYVKAFYSQLADWVKNNPYPYGANFKCGQECAIRMISCLMVYSVFSDEASDDDIKNIRELVNRCYRKILSNFFYSYKCQKNNHAISEVAGMIAGAWCCKDDKHLKKAYGLLDRIIDEQFCDDGGYIQQSFNYQRLALQDIEAVLSISDKTGYSISAHSAEKVCKSVLLMYQCQDVSGDMPNYGSNDGALVFPVTSCGYRDFRPVINTSYALLKNKRLFDSGFYDEELIWFGKKSPVEKEYIEKVSSQFPQAGLYTLRSEKYWLLIVAKKQINHMDQNHIDFWMNGINVLCDSGTYSYADDIGRDLFSTRAHNTLYCDKKEQVSRFGPFAVYGQPVLKKAEWSSDSFSSEIAFKSGYIHKRTVSLNDDGVVLTDETNSDGACVLFHTPCLVEIYDMKAEITGLCEMEFSAEPEIYQTKRSLYYLQTDNTDCIKVNATDRMVNTRIKIIK